MSNRPNWARKFVKQGDRVRDIKMTIDPERLREGHSVDVVSKPGDALHKIACICGRLWACKADQKDIIEREAFEHIYPEKGT